MELIVQLKKLKVESKNPMSFQESYFYIKSKFERWHFLYWMIACTALFFSYFFEFFWRIKPCFLCELQRLPFAIILLLIPLGSIFFSKDFIKNGLIVCLSLSCALASYHFFIQLRLIPYTCAIPNILTVEDFQKILETKTSCVEISWTFFGLPISAYNSIISFALVAWLILERIGKKLHRIKIN